MPQNTLVGRVMYRFPIPVETLFAPSTALRTPQGVEHSDQMLGTRLTRGPRRPERHVTVSQDHRGHPADTSVGKGLGKTFTTSTTHRRRRRRLGRPAGAAFEPAASSTMMANPKP